MRTISKFFSRAIFFALLVCPGLTQADWLNFRGPDASGFDASITDLPLELSEKTQAWKTPLPGRGLSSPLIIGERVFLTAASGPEQKQLHILCFDAGEGSLIWERRFWATGRTMAHKKTNVAAPTPASDGERIYALFSSNDLICLDLNGKVLWIRGLTLDYPNASNSLGMASSPLVVGDTLVAQIENDSESFAAGFDLRTGANRWKIDRPKSANWTSPISLRLGGEAVVALQSGDGIVGMVPATGSPIFRFPGDAATIPSSASSGDHLIVPANGLTAVRLSADGADPAPLWKEANNRPGTASPLVIGDKVYVINNAGVMACSSLVSGERIWRARLEGGAFSASPVAGNNGHLYVCNEDGVLQAVDLRGTEGKVVSSIALGESILGTPSLSQGAIYVRGDGHLWKFAK
jgi:outer membrane protein assembly factor BamB